ASDEERLAELKEGASDEERLAELKEGASDEERLAELKEGRRFVHTEPISANVLYRRDGSSTRSRYPPTFSIVET
ncbi:hypothetical protein KUCAC02_035976, partial [Chaenocephalus aceratus]